MICNAGRNYLVFKSNGQVFRCQCHQETPLGDMGDLDQWFPQVALSCPLMEECQRSHPGEWHRASRLDDQGKAVDRGSLSGQPDNEVVTRIFLTGETMRSQEEWCFLFERLARRFKKCWHRIEGDDPADFPGIAQLVEKVSFLGDQLLYVSDLSSRKTRIVDVLSKASVDCVRFTAVVNPSAPGFNEIKVLGRLRLIHERGFKVNAVMPGNMATFYLFEPFFEKFSSKYGIPMTFIPEVEFPEHMQERLGILKQMGSSPAVSKTDEQDSFSGL